MSVEPSTAVVLPSEEPVVSELGLGNDGLHSETSPSPLNLVDNKRPLADTSIEESTEQQESKNLRRDSASLPLDTILMFEKLENLITGLSSNFNARIDTFETSLNTAISYLTDKIEVLETRVSSVEENHASIQLAVENLDTRISSIEEAGHGLTNRIDSLETVPRTVLPERAWEPSEATSTKVLLLGDSNSAGKIKFGEGRGTLGSLFPGRDEFCAKLENLPGTDSDCFSGVTDVIISAGTNNLKEANSNPSELARNMFTYLKALSIRLPSAHIFLAGVLPVNAVDSPISARIADYNYFLCDLSSSLPRVKYVDVKVFRSRGGSLQQKFANGNSDILHLNDQGRKLLFSRFKFALRERYCLPNLYRTNSSRIARQPGIGGRPAVGSNGRDEQRRS